MIHPALTITEVAMRYYSITHPERSYDRHNAVRQWKQDKAIDKKVVRQVIDQIFKEQKKLIGTTNTQTR